MELYNREKKEEKSTEEISDILSKRSENMERTAQKVDEIPSESLSPGMFHM